MTIIVATLNLIKRKRCKKVQKLSKSKDLFGQNNGYSVGLLVAYTTHISVIVNFAINCLILSWCIFLLNLKMWKLLVTLSIICQRIDFFL